jgi:uncharacterized protein with beta-barrel porin domain
MKLQKLAGCAFGSALVLASSPSSALNFSFSFTNSIGNTAGTVTGVVTGLLNNATTAATDVTITGYPSAMTGLPPAPFSVLKLPYTSLMYNSFPVFNGQVQTDGNLGHGLFEFGSSNSYTANWDFCISGIGYATSPCMPPSWFSSWTTGWYNIRHVMTNDIAQFTPLAGATPSEPGTFTITFNFVPGQPSPSLLPSGASIPGTFTTVPGNLLFQPGASYSIYLNPASTTYAVVSGTASLAGTVNAQFLPGSYTAKQYDILRSTGLNGTTFGALNTSNLPANFIADLSYTSTDVLLNLTAALGNGTNLNGNQQTAANAINSWFNNGGGAMPPGFSSIFGLTGNALGTTLAQLSGEAATGAQRGAFQLTNQFLDIMLDPFVRGGGGMGAGPALSFAPERERLAADAYGRVEPSSFERRWSVWTGGYGGSNTTEGDPVVVGSHDVNARDFLGAAGIDYHFSPGTVAGVALAGGGANWDLAQGLGGGRSDALQAGIYGATRWGPAYLAGAFAFTNHWMSTDRFALGDHLTASFNAESYGGRVESGYRFAVPWFAPIGVTPYAAIQAQSFHTPAYNETDLFAGGFALGYNARTASDTRSELGGRFDYVAAANADMILTLRARAAWAHDWVSDPTLTPVFQSLPGASFIVGGAAPVHNSALASFGAEIKLRNGWTLMAKFDGDFANRSQTYAGMGIVRYAW